MLNAQELLAPARYQSPVVAASVVPISRTEPPSARLYSLDGILIFVTFAAARFDTIPTIFQRIEVPARVLSPPAGDETGAAGNSYF
jgi:hypothetical protein